MKVSVSVRDVCKVCMSVMCVICVRERDGKVRVRGGCEGETEKERERERGREREGKIGER